MQNSRKRNSRWGRRPANGRRKSGRGGSVRSGPPEIVTTLALGHVFRFTNTAAFTSKGITRAMLLQLLSMATTTTNQFRLITAIKLKRVQIWGQPPALAGASTAVVVEWVGQQAPSTLHSDLSQGIRPAYVSTRPPVDSSDRWWSISGQNESEILFKITGPIGSVVDITVSLRLVDDEAAVASEAGTGAGATVGTVYYNYLDGFASKLLIPAGGVTALP